MNLFSGTRQKPAKERTASRTKGTDEAKFSLRQAVFSQAEEQCLAEHVTGSQPKERRKLICPHSYKA